jgi:hypothetical protein
MVGCIMLTLGEYSGGAAAWVVSSDCQISKMPRKCCCLDFRIPLFWS